MLHINENMNYSVNWKNINNSVNLKNMNNSVYLKISLRNLDALWR